MIICLLRHGQSGWQVLPGDDLDQPLTQLGHQQSKRTAAWLKDGMLVAGRMKLKIGCLHVSPLIRARETAGYLANSLQLREHVQPTLREAPFRVANHLPIATSPQDTTVLTSVDNVYGDFKTQAREALGELLACAVSDGRAVLAVTHGGLIETILRLIVDCDTVRFPQSNTALNVIEWDEKRWNVQHLNYLEHLPVDLRTS